MKKNKTSNLFTIDNTLFITLMLLGVTSYIMPFKNFIQVNTFSIVLFSIFLFYKYPLKISSKGILISCCLGLLFWTAICDYTNNCFSEYLWIYYAAIFLVFIYSTSIRIRIIDYSIVCSIISLISGTIFLIENEPTSYHVAILAIQIVATPCSLFLTILYHRIKQYPAFSLFALILVFNLILIVLSESRASWISLILSFSILFIHKTKIKHHNYKLLLAIFCIVAILLCSYFYYLKPDSVKGRLLIYNTCLKLFQESPLTGLGSFGFFREYMFQQKDFLEVSSIENFQELADNVYRPFNIVLSVIVKYGIVGLIFIICIIKIIYNNIIKSLLTNTLKGYLTFSIITSLLVFSLFSYPFEYPTTIILFLFACGLCMKHRKNNNTYTIPSYVKHLLAIIFIVFSFVQISSEYLWYKNQKTLEENNSESTIKKYADIYRILKHNPDFLYNYAVELNYLELYAESNQILAELTPFVNDYNTELLWGDNYYGLREYDNAEKHFTTAKGMIPTRFMPLLGLLKIYAETSPEKADSISHIIDEKTMKVHSEDAVRVKKIALRWLNFQNLDYGRINN